MHSREGLIALPGALYTIINGLSLLLKMYYLFSAEGRFFLLFKTIGSSTHGTLVAGKNNIRGGEVFCLSLQLVQGSQRCVH